MEKHNLKYEPKYFQVWEKPYSTQNPSVKTNETNLIQYIYNGLYFEKDRKEKNWSRLPDIFSDKLPFDISKENLGDIQPKDGEEDEKHHEYDAEEHARLTAGTDIVQ